MDEPNPHFEDSQDIRDRTFEFACRIVRFCEKLYESGGIARMMAQQLLDCSTRANASLATKNGPSRPSFTKVIANS